jgi:hypothetical protein
MNSKKIWNTVVKEHNHEELVRKDAELIKHGWKPLGGIAIATGAPIADVCIFCQAMIREKP